MNNVLVATKKHKKHEDLSDRLSLCFLSLFVAMTFSLGYEV